MPEPEFLEWLVYVVLGTIALTVHTAITMVR